jgi:environmental stress-induced protein Ves
VKFLKYIAENSWKTLPWKNGKGKTVQLVIHPENSIFFEENFDWRMSLATISETSAFSIFEGYDRVLTKIHGDSMTLIQQNKSPQNLELNTAFYFTGEEKVECVLHGKEATDLNAMIKREYGRLEMQFLSCIDSQKSQISTHADFIFLFVSKGEFEISHELFVKKLSFKESCVFEGSGDGLKKILGFNSSEGDSTLIAFEIFKHRLKI